jgi:DNA-binding response OmpR family regulator
MKLVVVDDDSLLCGAIARCLVRLGHSSRMAATVEAGLALIAAEAPAAVLTDLDLGGGGDGVHLIRRLREAGSRVPVLMMTASERAAARARLDAAGLGEIALLEKPFELDELLRRLAEILPPSFLPQPSATTTPARGSAMGAIMGSVLQRIGGRVI